MTEFYLRTCSYSAKAHINEFRFFFSLQITKKCLLKRRSLYVQLKNNKRTVHRKQFYSKAKSCPIFREIMFAIK